MPTGQVDQQVKDPKISEELLARAAQDLESLNLEEVKKFAEYRISEIAGDPNIKQADKDEIIGNLRSALISGDRGKIITALTNSDISKQADAKKKSDEIAQRHLVETDFMTAKYDLDSTQGRYDFARAMVGGDQPEGVIELIAEDIEKDPQMRAAAHAWSGMTPEQRAIRKQNQAITAKASTELAEELGESPRLTEEQQKYFANIADDRGLPIKKDRRTLEALQRYEQDGNFEALKKTTDGIESEFEARRVTKRRRAVEKGMPASYGDAAALEEYDFLTTRNQPGARMLDKIRSKETTQALLEEVATFRNMTTGTDEERVDALVAAYKATNPNKKFDETLLRKAALKHVSENEAGSEGPVVDYKALIYTAMEEGVQAMLVGDTARAKQLAQQVSDIMAAPGSGYTKEQASVARTLLMEGAEEARKAYDNDKFGIMGRHELLMVLRDPEKKAVIIQKTYEDIQNSTPDNLKHTAKTQMEIYAVGKLAGKTANKAGEAVGAMASAAASKTEDVATSVLGAENMERIEAAKKKAAQAGATIANGATDMLEQARQNYLKIKYDQADINDARKEFLRLGDVNKDGKLDINEIKKVMAANGVSYKDMAGKDGVLTNLELADAASKIPDNRGKPAPGRQP